MNDSLKPISFKVPKNTKVNIRKSKQKIKHIINRIVKIKYIACIMIKYLNILKDIVVIMTNKAMQ